MVLTKILDARIPKNLEAVEGTFATGYTRHGRGNPCRVRRDDPRELQPRVCVSTDGGSSSGSWRDKTHTFGCYEPVNQKLLRWNG